MAVLQCCCRNLLIYNTSRLINRNGTLLQPNRSRHHLVSQIVSPQNRMFLQKKKLLFNSDRQHLIFRLASTNTPKETVSNTSKSETATESVASSSNSEVLSNSEAVIVQSSNGNVIIDESSLPPAPVVDGSDVPVMEFVSTGLKEPSFESLGLGSWWPPGLIQQLFEYLHINLDMPWWQAIVAVSFGARILLFPINVSVRRDTVKMVNCLPEISRYQEKMTEARLSGDYYAVASAAHELQTFLKEKKLNMFAVFKTLAFQAPVFISMLYALKGMANAPVESLKTGGLFWFTDLTAADPYYILPLTVCSTLLFMIEIGAEGNPAKTNTTTVKWFLRGIPVVAFFFSVRLSSCVTWYWTVSNLIVLCQVGLFRIPAVGKFLNIPKAIKFDNQKIGTKKKGFLEGFKEGYSNARITGQIEDRERVNLMEFQKAGSGAIPRTFKRNPLLAKEKK